MRPRYAATYLLLVAWSLVCLFPVYWLAITSIKPAIDMDTGPKYLPWVDFTPSLRAWYFILFDSEGSLVLRFVNSAVVGLAASILTIMIGGMACYGLTRFDYRFRCISDRPANRAIMWGILATRVLPPIAIVLPIYLMAMYTGTLDSWTALILTYTAVNLPVAMWLLQPVLGLGPSEQEDAARLDGASHLLVFFTIVLPMAAGGLAAAGLLIFVLCWNEYLLAAYLTTSRAMTLPVWVVEQMSYREAQTSSSTEEWANFSAAAIFIVLPMIAFAGIALRVLGRRTAWKT